MGVCVLKGILPNRKRDGVLDVVDGWAFYSNPILFLVLFRLGFAFLGTWPFALQLICKHGVLLRLIFILLDTLALETGIVFNVDIAWHSQVHRLYFYDFSQRSVLRIYNVRLSIVPVHAVQKF